MTTPQAPDWYTAAAPIWEQFADIEHAAAAAVDDAVMVPVRAAIDAIIGRAGGAAGAASAGASDPAVDGRVPVAVAFAEQFVVDVAAMTDAVRQPLFASLGADTLAFVQAVYVADIFGRARVALDRLFGDVERALPSAAVVADGAETLWPRIERFMQEVARRSALDPLTSELVRLRGARFHNCRLCQSRRSVKAIDAAGDLEALDALGSRVEDLTARQQVALELTDALVTQPQQIDASLAARARQHLSVDELVELVLDVVRNAANKIAVAFGADEPVVDDGIEFYDIDASGDVVADVDRSVVTAATAG